MSRRSAKVFSEKQRDRSKSQAVAHVLKYNHEVNEKLPQLLPLVIAVVFLVILLAFKVKLGLSLFISSGVLLVFSGNGPVELVEIVRRTVTDGQFLEIIGIILLINLLEELLRKTNYFDRAFQVLQGTVKNRVKITALFPALFGLIPAFGGAKFSASLVDLAAQDLAIDRTEKSLLNYWFRHVWEFCSPLFPGVILAIYLSGVETGKYILLMLPSTILFIVLGTVFFSPSGKRKEPSCGGGSPRWWPRPGGAKARLLVRLSTSVPDCLADTGDCVCSGCV